MGILGILIASTGIEDFFVPYLVFLGTFMPPVAGVIMVDYYVFRMRGSQIPEFDTFEPVGPIHWLACVSVILGGIIAQQLAEIGSIFGAASVTSFVFGGLFYFLLKLTIPTSEI
jgi:cytosine permease